MVLYLDWLDVCRMVRGLGLTRFLQELMTTLEADFRRWCAFTFGPRHVTKLPEGNIDLMPCADAQHYAFKYVNSHPANPLKGMRTIVAFGALAEAETGYPCMIAELTLLTAMRTAAVAAIGARYLARPDAEILGIIGTGAQSEFVVEAMRIARPIRKVRFYDKDPAAMEKFSSNLCGKGMILQPCLNASQIAESADILVTATAPKGAARILSVDDVHPGQHIHALGGDALGKTELDPRLLPRCKIVVEAWNQARYEGEIQNDPNVQVHGELWEIVCGDKPGRETAEEITLFDAVGVAVEDFSSLRLLYCLAKSMQIGKRLPLVPQEGEGKDLYGLLCREV